LNTRLVPAQTLELGTWKIATHCHIGSLLAIMPSSVNSFRYVHVKGLIFLILCIDLCLGLKCSSRNPTELSLTTLRGGRSYIEINPNHVQGDLNRYMPPKLGDLEDDYIRRPVGFDHHTQNSQAPKPMMEVVKDFFVQLHQISPTLFHGTVASIIIFLTWQIPVFAPILKHHFVCSKRNIHQGRFYTLLTAAISHGTLTHLLMNLFGFITFGKSVGPVLKQNNIPLSMYCICSAILSNWLFTLVHPQGSCIGLSGVAMSLFAFESKFNPSKEMRFFLKFFPIRLPAQHALSALLFWSILGTITTNAGNGDGIAHATHLFGLLYGLTIYEMIKRGYWREIRRFWLRNRHRNKKY